MRYSSKGNHGGASRDDRSFDEERALFAALHKKGERRAMNVFLSLETRAIIADPDLDPFELFPFIPSWVDADLT